MKDQVAMYINVRREVTEVRIVPVIVTRPPGITISTSEGRDAHRPYQERVLLFAECEPGEHRDSYALRQFAQEAVSRQ